MDFLYGEWGVRSYEFVPRIVTGSVSKVVIDIYRDKPAIGAFHFVGSQLSNVETLVDPKSPTIDTRFHYSRGPTSRSVDKIHSLQAIGTSPPALFDKEPYFSEPTRSGSELRATVNNKGPARFYHPFAHVLLEKLAVDGLDDLFDYYATKIPDDNPNVPHKIDAFGGDAQPVVYHELKRAYSLYNWEIAFHAPMLLVDRLLDAQQFDQALKMCHYVLNPYAKGKGIDDDKRFWQFFPFKEIDATNVLEKLFLGLQPKTPDAAHGQINEWRDKPFQPHAVARSRPSAYMKWVAMKYIEILIAYGDYYFRQNTLETIPLAIQCYVLASHCYGPRGQKIPKRGKTLPQTYNSRVPA